MLERRVEGTIKHWTSMTTGKMRPLVLSVINQMQRLVVMWVSAYQQLLSGQGREVGPSKADRDHAR